MNRKLKQFWIYQSPVRGPDEVLSEKPESDVYQKYTQVIHHEDYEAVLRELSQAVSINEDLSNQLEDATEARDQAKNRNKKFHNILSDNLPVIDRALSDAEALRERISKFTADVSKYRNLAKEFEEYAKHTFICERNGPEAECQCGLKALRIKLQELQDAEEKS